MHGRHISLTRGVSLAGPEQRVYEFLDANLPPSCSVWPGVRLRQGNDRRTHTIDLLVLGHHSLYVVEIKHSSRAHVRELLDDAYEQVLQYAHLVGAAIDGEPPGPRPWIQPLVTLLPEPPSVHLPPLPFLLDPPALVRAAVSGELPGHPGSPPRAPLDARTIEAIRKTFDDPEPRDVQLYRLKHQLLDATPSTCEAPELAVASWVTTACFLLLAQARAWARPLTTPADHEAWVAMSKLPCIQALRPAGIPPLTALSGTLLRALYDALEPLVSLAPDDWRSSGGAWSELYETLPSSEQRVAHATITTPSFISDFLCDRTLKPAIDVFGAHVVHVLDPACGAGTMLCAAFHRLLDAGHVTPLDVLGRVHGIDVDPIAVLISRTRLLTAFLERAVSPQINHLSHLPIHVIAADALLTEPPSRYHAVVCNPPANTGKDAVAIQRYRDRFPNSAHGKFSLAAPFIERCFQLAETEGFVGIFTSNSFAQRAFGKRLVEVVLANLDIDSIVNTSSVFIPGHGIPTLMLFGRNRPPTSDELTIVSPKSAELTAPPDPAKGAVWRAITQHHADFGHEDDRIVADRALRSQVLRHPMNLTLGPARALLNVLETASARTLHSLTHSIGFGGVSGADDVFTHTRETLARMKIEPRFVCPFIRGSSLSPWMARPKEYALALEHTPADDTQHTTTYAWRYLLRHRPVLEQRLSLSKRPSAWWCWLRWNADTSGERCRILAPYVARTPHFVLARISHHGKEFRPYFPS